MAKGFNRPAGAGAGGGMMQQLQRLLSSFSRHDFIGCAGVGCLERLGEQTQHRRIIIHKKQPMGLWGNRLQHLSQVGERAVSEDHHWFNRGRDHRHQQLRRRQRRTTRASIDGTGPRATRSGGGSSCRTAAIVSAAEAPPSASM